MDLTKSAEYAGFDIPASTITPKINTHVPFMALVSSRFFMSKPRNMLSSAAPMNVRPPAVVIGPPPRLEPPVLTPAGTPSIVPKGICQAISPVFTLIAVSLPQGGAQHGQPVTDRELPSLAPTLEAGRPNNRVDSPGALGSESCCRMMPISPESVVLMM